MSLLEQLSFLLEIHADTCEVLIRFSFTSQLGAAGSSGTIELKSQTPVSSIVMCVVISSWSQLLDRTCD